MRIAFLLLVLFFPALSSAGQTAAPRAAARPLATIQGRVLTADEAQPVRRARVAVVADGTSSFPVFTDDAGRFVLRVPASGSYTVTVRKAGFVRLSTLRTASRAGAALEVRLARAAVLSGRVVDPAGRPVTDVAVRARRLDAPGRGAATPLTDPIGETNDSGEFRIHGVPAGRYQLHTQPAIDGFHSLDSIAPSVRQQALDKLTAALMPTSAAVLADAISGQETSVVIQHSAPAVLGVYATAGSALTGVVSDELGEPLDGITVAVWKVEFDGGRQQAMPPAHARVTDDRGVFRLFHLPPGRYLVVATDGRWRPDGPEASTHLPVFYPGRTTIADALEVEIPRGGGININANIVFSWTRGVSVRGVVTSTVPGARDQLVTLARSFRSGGVAPPLRSTPTRAGSFEFPNVAQGDYVIRVTGAQTPQLIGPTAPAEYAMQYLSVGPSDVGPISVTTTPMSTISGRVRVEGDIKAVNPTQIGLTAIPFDPDSAPTMAVRGVGASIRPDWTFELGNLAGAIRIALSPISERQGWWIKSVDMGGVDASREPVMFGRPGDSRDDVTIVVSTAVGTLSARVFDGTRPADDCWVVVFAVDANRWFSGSPFLRRVSATQGARYAVPSLPPGDYWVVAIDEDVSGTWLNPDVLNGLVSSARRVTIVEGQQVSLDLRLVRVPR